MPGSENASPRSAASSSASAREPRCSAQPYGILDEVARAFAQPDHRRRRQLDVQAAEAGHDARGNGQRFRCAGVAVGRFAVRRDGFRRHEELDRDDVLERVGLVAKLDRHLHARAADALRRRVEPRLDRAAGGHLQRLLARRR